MLIETPHGQDAHLKKRKMIVLFIYKSYKYILHHQIPIDYATPTDSIKKREKWLQTPIDNKYFLCTLTTQKLKIKDKNIEILTRSKGVSIYQDVWIP